MARVLKSRFGANTIFASACLCSGALANGITESNYRHIDKRTSINADGAYSALDAGRGVQHLSSLLMGSNLIVKNEKLYVVAKRTDQASIALLYEENVCAIGFKVRENVRGIRNSVRITFEFFDETGAVIDQKVRWPAGGTTNQSFESDSFEQRFRAVVVSAEWSSELALLDIRAVSCASLLS